MGSTVDSTCKGCQYIGTVSTGKCCTYSIVTGHSRGCPAGFACDKYSGPPRQKLVPKEEKKPNSAQPKSKRPPGRSHEEAYEREKARKRKRYLENRARLNGRQKDAITAFKEETGFTNRKIADLLGIKESRIQFWCNEYAEADWELLSKVGIKKPEGLE